jgi:hypothetical protein
VRNFYFEVLIIDSGKKDGIAVGVCGKNYPVDQMPGWDPLSIGYHGDDGLIIVESGEYATNTFFTAGDHIGVLLDYDTATLTFFREKKRVHKVQLKTHFMNEDLYPCVGFLDAKGGIVRLVSYFKN